MQLALLPAAYRFEAVGDDLLKLLIRVDQGVGALRKRVLQFSFNPMRGGAGKILRIGPRLDAKVSGDFARAEVQKPSFRWPAHLGKNLEYRDMADSVDDQVVARRESRCRKHVAAERRRIRIDPLLAKILERLAVVGIAAATDDLAPQVIPKASASPAERLGDCSTDRGFPAADLTRKAEQQAHAKSNVIWRERSETQPRRSRLSQLTAAIDVGVSSSIKVA